MRKPPPCSLLQPAMLCDLPLQPVLLQGSQGACHNAPGRGADAALSICSSSSGWVSSCAWQLDSSEPPQGPCRLAGLAEHWMELWSLRGLAGPVTGCSAVPCRSRSWSLAVAGSRWARCLAPVQTCEVATIAGAAPARDFWGLPAPELPGPGSTACSWGSSCSALWCARCHRAPSVMGQLAKFTSLHHAVTFQGFRVEGKGYSIAAATTGSNKSKAPCGDSRCLIPSQSKLHGSSTALHRPSNGAQACSEAKAGVTCCPSLA